MARPSQCLKGLDREWSMPLHRRMRLKLLPEALVRDELLLRGDVESIGTAKPKKTQARHDTRKRFLLRESHLLPSILSFGTNVSYLQQIPMGNASGGIRFSSDSMQVPGIHPKRKHLASPQHSGASLNLLEGVCCGGCRTSAAFTAGASFLTLASSRPWQ